MQKPEGEDTANSRNGAGCPFSKQGENKGLLVGLKRVLRQVHRTSRPC